tara:strand:- start:1078 stop:1317 length:240 start_codon:yes stop_codon:yes gene_type:complete
MSIKIKKKTVNDLEEDLSAKVGLFDKLPEFCLTCNGPFDKKNREMVSSWYVIIRDQKTVRLYCPSCWDKAREFLKEVEK